MDSKSSNKYKKRASSRRRISSILNQSPTKLNASKGDINRKIRVLMKNNQTLAEALQDARCELSSKQKLLERASEYFKTIMLARVRMVTMWSALNSVLQDFDGTMQMLKCDNFKISDITPPFQSSGKFKNKMKKIAEAVASVYEENSFLCRQDNEESDCENSADSPNSIGCASANSCPAPMEVTKNIPHDKSSELGILQASTKNCIIPDNSSHDPTVPCSPNKALVDPCCKEETTLITTDSLIASYDTGTPKLSLPSVIPVIDSQKSPDIASSFKMKRTQYDNLNEKDSSVAKKLPKTPEKYSDITNSVPKRNDSSVKKLSKIPTLNGLKSSQKDLNSKISRFHTSRNMTIKGTSLLDEVSKVKSVYPKKSNKKNVSIPKETNEIDCRRKTFVVKSLPETAVSVDENDVADANNLEEEQNFETSTSRKTFVVRGTSALEKKRKSINNKRKTFVKKCNKNSSPKSTKNRRGTFVLNDVNENCTEEGELLTDYSINSECENLVKESNEPCAMTDEEALPLDTNDPHEMNKNLLASKTNCFIPNNLENKNQESSCEDLCPGIYSEPPLETLLAFKKKCQSENDKRKTFVKKCDKSNSCKSKNKRGTFVLTDIHENCTEDGEPSTKNLVNSECDDLVKELSNKPCALTNDKALPSASNECCEITKNLQPLEKNWYIDKPGIENQISCSDKLLPEVSSTDGLKKYFVNSLEIKDVINLISDTKDTGVVNLEEKIGGSDKIKSTILPQNPSVGWPIEADRTTNEKESKIKDVNKFISNKKDNKVVNRKEKIDESKEIKSTILPQNPSVILPVQADKTTNEKESKMKDFNKLISNKKDARIVKFDEKIVEMDGLKSAILSQNPSVVLPVKADKTTNEAKRNTPEGKTSEEDKNNCIVDKMECDNGNLLLKNGNKKPSVILPPVKHVTSKVGTPEKEPTGLQTFSQPHFSKIAIEKSEKKNVSKENEKSKQSVPKMEVDNKEDGKGSIKSKETNEKCKSGTKHDIDVIKVDETNKNNLQPLVFASDEEIIIMDNDEGKRKSRSRRKKSYKMFLELSNSECESISEIENLENFENEIDSYVSKPIVRGKVSFSSKKNYVFSKKAEEKIKPQKYSKKSKSCKNLSNELASASSADKNYEGNNLNSDVNKKSENAEKIPSLHSKSDKLEMDSKHHVKFCDTQETKLNTVKSTENLVYNQTNTDIKIHKNSTPQISDQQNKIISPSTYSPVISLDKCLNDIECDNENRKEKADKNYFSGETTPKAQNSEAADANNIKKQTKSVKVKKTKKNDPLKNQPKKKKKQAVESDVGKENVEDSKVNSNKEVKTSSPKSNAIVVEAEIHPLPRTLNQLDKNIDNTTNYEVAVVLSDIFQSRKVDFSSVNNKNKRDRNYIINSPLTNNSSNIQIQATNKTNVIKEEVDEDLTGGRRSKRTKAVNYAEPRLNKKMRR